MSSPPSAGPPMLASSNRLEFHDTALRNRGGGTMRGRIALRAGIQKLRAAPMTTSSA